MCTLIGTTGVLHAVNDYRMASKGSMHPLFLVATDWRIRALRMGSVSGGCRGLLFEGLEGYVAFVYWS